MPLPPSSPTHFHHNAYINFLLQVYYLSLPGVTALLTQKPCFISSGSNGCRTPAIAQEANWHHAVARAPYVPSGVTSWILETESSPS